MRRRMMAGAVALGCAGLLVLVLGTPATANRATGGMATEDVAADCRRAAMDTPSGGSGALQLTADVADGATVEPGESIKIRLAWDPKAWSGEELDMALACVEVKGMLDPGLSSGERPTANDGAFEYTLQVPENIKPDCDICVQGFLAGMAAGGGPQRVGSNSQCFMSGPPKPLTPPATQPPAPPADPPATPPAAPPSPARVPTDVPAEVAGITVTQPAAPAPALAPTPAPAPAPAVAPTAELPRTGPLAIQLASAGGGLTLTLGGLAVMGGAGRRTRRRTAV